MITAFLKFSKNAVSFFVLAFCLCAFADEKVVVRTFSEPVFLSAPDGYVRLAVDGADRFAPIGKPAVPFVTERLELPRGAQDISLETSAVSSPGLLPALPEFTRLPVSSVSADAARRGGPDAKVYGRDAFYPASFAELVTVQASGESLFAVIRVYPLRVNPSALTYEYAREVTVRVTYSASVPKAAVKRAPKSGVSAAAASDWRYLIVTTNTLASAFEPLAAYKRQNGTPTQIINVADIYAQYEGRDAAEKVRNCIRDGYENHGTEYVLLGGYHSIVPVRKAYGNVDPYTGAVLGSDLYYACLDGSWDGDGDNVFGEPNDGEHGGDVDLAAEVAVGRAPAASVADVANFVAKTLEYTTNAHCNASSALMLGEYLGKYTDEETGSIFYPQGGNGLDELADVLRAYNWTWLDDRPNHRHTWGENEVESEINKMPNLVVHNGHGDASMSLFLTPTRIRTKLRNTSPFFINSISCHAGKMTDASESVGEALLNAPRGAVGVVMNSNYGWFDTEAEGMYSGEFVGPFFAESVVHGRPAGLSLQLSKQSLLAKVEHDGDMVYRWCYFENNLFGDPQLLIVRPADSLKILPPESADRFMKHGQTLPVDPYEFRVYNTYDSSVEWSVTSDSPLFSVSAARGSSQTVSTNVVTVSVSPSVSSLPAGTYLGEIVFSNLTRTVAESYTLSLSVIDAPSVTDLSGVAVTSVDFGSVTNGTQVSRTVRLVNNDLAAGVVVDRFSYNGEITMKGIPDIAYFMLYDQFNGFLDVYSLTSGGEIEQLYYYYYFLGGLETIPGDDSLVYAIDFENDLFVTFDLEMNAFGRKEIDVVSGGGTWGGLAYSPYHGRMFAAYAFDDTASGEDYGTTRFFAVDHESGSFTPLGSSEGIVTGIAFSSDGTMYALELTDNALLEINPFTGEIVRRLRLDRDIEFSQGLDFDASGTVLYTTLYSADDDCCNLCTVDVRTGDVRELHPLIEGGQFEMTCLPSEAPFRVCPPVFPLSLPPGGSIDIEIVCSPTSTGEFSEVFGLHFPDSETPVVSLQLTCAAVQPSRIATPWLEKYGLPCDGSADDADADGDGVSNYSEWLAFTDPLNPLSRFAVKAVSADSIGFRLDWDSVPGLNYRVESARTPSGPFSPLATVTAKGCFSSYMDFRAQSNCFYRVTLPHPPRSGSVAHE